MHISLIVLHLFLTALKRTFARPGLRPLDLPVVIEIGRQGASLWATQDGLALRYHLGEPANSHRFVLTARDIDELGSRNRGTVELELTGDKTICARWQERGIPRFKQLAEGTAPGALPERPGSFAKNDTGLLQALDDSMRTAGKEATRFGLQTIQLRGAKGEIVGSDGRQLLLQAGFQFPWQEDVLVPRSNFFGWKELCQAKAVQIGRTDKHVCVEADDWTVWLPIDKESRYPRVEQIVPDDATACTRLELDSEDARFLCQSLPGMPGKEAPDAPLTVDVNGKVAVRAREEQGRTTELILTRTSSLGTPTQFATDRNYFARALEMGFTHARIFSPDKPILCHDASRKYLWVPLDRGAIIAASANDLRIESQISSTQHAATPPRNSTVAAQSRQERNIQPMKPTFTPVSETPPGQIAPSGDFAALQEEARCLQNILRDAVARSNGLLAGLKQYRRRARAIQTSLATLKQLETVEV